MPQSAGRILPGRDQRPTFTPTNPTTPISLHMIDDVSSDRDEETAYSLTLTWCVSAPSAAASSARGGPVHERRPAG